MTSPRFSLGAIAFCLSFLALTASSASAITITLSDVNIHNFDMNNGTGNSVLTGTWDLTADTDWTTFVSPATNLTGWNIDSVQIAIVIANDAGSDAIRILLDATQFFTATGTLDWNPIPWTSDVGLVSGTLFGSISADGMLDYRIERTSTTGAFQVQTASLTVDATNPNISLAVPDGGTTLTMLGLGMVGLGALRRKLGA